MFPKLTGNLKIKNSIGEKILRGTLGHALILEGPKGSGRHTAALEISASFVCSESSDAENFPCGVCPSCKKLYDGFCPDVTFVNSGDKATIGVKIIRDMINSLVFAPLEAKRKIYIIEDAEKMTKEAQNSLLLSLEEPPEYILFILITTSALSLLETVRSRAPVFKMERFDADVIYEYIKNSKKGMAIEKKEPGTLHRIASASHGIIGKAEQLCGVKDSSALTIRRNLAMEAVLALCCGNASQCIEISIKLSSDKDKAMEIISEMKLVLRDCAAEILQVQAVPCFFTDKLEISEFSMNMTLKKIVDAYRAVCKAHDALKHNAYLSGTISAMMMSHILGAK